MVEKKLGSVCVVIPNYKGEDYLVPCIESVLASKVVGRKVVIRIVDNASEDEALTLLEKALLSKGYKCVDSKEARIGAPQKSEAAMIGAEEQSEKEYRYSGFGKEMVNEGLQPCVAEIYVTRLGENTGFCHAVNVGIWQSREEYVFLLNNDTRIEPECIEALATFMDYNHRAFSAGAQMLDMKNPSIADDCGDYYNLLGYARGRGKGKKASEYNEVCEVTAACAGAAMYRRDLLRGHKIGCFDEAHFAYLEDMDLGIRAGLYGYQNYYVPEAKVLHAGSAVSGSKHNAFKQRLSGRNNIYLLYKNFPNWMLGANLLFLVAGQLIKLLYFSLKGLGGAYLGGIREGLALIRTKEAETKRVPFSMKRLHHYLKLEGNLIRNLGRR